MVQKRTRTMLHQKKWYSKKEDLKKKTLSRNRSTRASNLPTHRPNDLSKSWLGLSDFCLLVPPPEQQTLCVCCRHVKDVGPTKWQHSVMSAFFYADGVVPEWHFPNTLSCMLVGISTSEKEYSSKQRAPGMLPTPGAHLGLFGGNKINFPPRQNPTGTT
jgi:hypothetical protein